jgi:hypothetical protein
MFFNKKFPFIIFVLIVGCLNQYIYAQTYSQLWGKNGEAWDKNKIPDFTKAGYKQGKEAIPVYKSQVDVTKFGAVGDGKTDNTMAFRKAIQQCGNDQAVYIPTGTYLLSDSLVIHKSNICIRGDGAGKTRLFFSKGLEELYPDYNVHYKNQTEWSWGGAVILFTGNITGCGIENLSIAFPDSIWAGHNFHERAYDGIGFSEGAHDGWIRNVTIINADLGIWIERSAHHITAENWTLDFGPNRSAQKISGHHGVNIYGGYNLLQGFEIRGKYQHDLSVESNFSVYNVFHNGSGKDICIDHHNHAQSHNLFTNIDAGIGSRIYASGGNDTPRGICSYEAFWNIRTQQPMLYCNQFDTKDSHSTNNVCVGIRTNQPSQFNDLYGNWFETIDPIQLYPADLYEAQMKLEKIKR